MAKKKDGYNNPNGEMSIEEMIMLKHKGQIEDFLKQFRVTKHSCPNSKLKPKNIKCFYCSDCWIESLNKIKELKTCYKVKGKKYNKEEFDENRK